MKILTCNVRYYSAPDGPNAWIYRRDLCADVIRSRDPDVIGFQELCAPQQADLSAALPGYRTFGMADNPTGRNLKNCIFYRADLFELISAGAYWLSESPHVPGIKSWQSGHVRLANWVRLQAKSAPAEFRLVNTHLDNLSPLARENQARLLVEDAAGYPADYPQLLTGDFNGDNTDAACRVIKQGGWRDTYDSVHGTENPGHTFHKFAGDAHPARAGKMDWIFMRGRMRAVDAEVITDARDGRYPSDHYFVAAVVEVSGA